MTERLSKYPVSSQLETAQPLSEPPRRFAETVSLPDDIHVKKLPHLHALEEELPYGEILYPGTTAYERGVNIGNLLYRLKTPAAIVQPRDTSDVVKIVNFCRDNGIQLTVKNGGHSYAGYCLNKGGIVMDMGAMIHVDIEDHQAVIHGGATWEMVYAKLVPKHQSKIVIGGQCPGVGVSGFTLGAGLSPFSRSYGLGIDNVNEMTIVTADGKLVTVNNHEEDPDRQKLFWGLCGGGGGNFGVLVEFKTKLHTLKHSGGLVTCGQLKWNLDKHLKEFTEMMVAFDTDYCEDALTIDAVWRPDPNVPKGLLGQMTVIYNGDRAECDKALAHILKFNPDHNDLHQMQWSDWVHKEEGFGLKDKIYHHHASFIFAKGALTREVVELINGLMQEAQRRFHVTDEDLKKVNFHFLWDHIGGKSAAIAPNATAFPWRTGAYVCNIKLMWNCPKLDGDMIDFAHTVRTTLGPFTVDRTACYINYIDSTVEDWQKAYYGDNYPALQEVKQIWDPENFFHFERSIELPGRTRQVDEIRPIPMGAADRGLLWSVPVLQPEQISPGPIPIRSVEHDIAPKTALERTVALWSEYKMDVQDVQDLKEDDDEELYLNRIGAARVERLNQEMSMIGSTI